MQTHPITLALPALFLLAACSSREPHRPPRNESGESSSSEGRAGSPGIRPSTPPERPAPPPPRRPAQPPEMRGPIVLIETSRGSVRVQLDEERAPGTVRNFLQYAQDGFYEGTIFHRVIDDFMIQGGGFTPDMAQKPTRAPIALEIHRELRHWDGAIAMARTSDPNSATAQFYLCDGPQHRLDDAYAPFGRVIEGMDVVHAIAGVPTGTRNGMRDVPQEDVLILSVRRE